MYDVTVHWLHGRPEVFKSTEFPEIGATVVKLVEDWATSDAPHERYLVLAAMKMFEIYSGDA